MKDLSVPWLPNAAALFVALTGVPLWFRKVPPNRLYGFRTSRTFSSARL
jgi:hypothetical protein